MACPIQIGSLYLRVLVLLAEAVYQYHTSNNHKPTLEVNIQELVNLEVVVKSKPMDLHNKIFKALANSDKGEVNDETRFHYRQEGEIIWATYGGGEIRFGTLSGVVDNDQLYFQYQHQNAAGDYLRGVCNTTITIENGKYHLHEQWQWTCLDHSKGTSELIEVES